MNIFRFMNTDLLCFVLSFLELCSMQTEADICAHSAATFRPDEPDVIPVKLYHREKQQVRGRSLTQARQQYTRSSHTDRPHCQLCELSNRGRSSSHSHVAKSRVRGYNTPGRHVDSQNCQTFAERSVNFDFVDGMGGDNAASLKINQSIPARLFEDSSRPTQAEFRDQNNSSSRLQTDQHRAASSSDPHRGSNSFQSAQAFADPTVPIQHLLHHCHAPSNLNQEEEHAGIEQEIAKDIIQALRNIGDNLDEKMKGDGEIGLGPPFDPSILSLRQMMVMALPAFDVTGMATQFGLRILETYHRL